MPTQVTDTSVQALIMQACGCMATRGNGQPCSRELARTRREASGLLRDVDGLVHEGLPATSLVHGVAGLRVAQHETNYEPLAAIVSAGVAVKERRRAFDPGTHDAP